MPRPQPHKVAFFVSDGIGHKLRKVFRPGRLFNVAGVDLKLFEIRVMAEAIGRTPRTLKDWEREGVFPKPMYVVNGTRCNRWYSERQILHANKVWMKYRQQGKSKHFDRTGFLAEIMEDFYLCDMPLVDDANKESDKR